MIPDLNIRGMVTRVLELDGRHFELASADESFMCSLEPPRNAKPDDGSPRDLEPSVLRWRSGLLGPGLVPQAGWRVSCTRPIGGRPYENLVYELLEDPREMRTGAITQGIQARVASVGTLYPYAGELQEQDGTELGDIAFALWSEREDHQSTGTYEEFSGEAPVEFTNELGTNRRIVSDGQTYRITSSILDLEGPRVKFEARRSGA